ncbi:MAG: putative nucleic acid-binding Zn-ribbon protein [Planctomycetota bacterium]|jgi:predicted  nucleic acid-binding Zn-ribbon protein
MMNRSRRGAARVSITWMIVVLIAFFASLAMVFVFDGEVSKAQASLATAEENAAVAEQKYDEERAFSRELSETLGYYDKELGSARSVNSSATEGLNQFKDGFNVTEVSVVDFQTMVARAVDNRGTLTQRIRDLEQQISTLQADIDVRSANLASMTSDKDGQIRGLSQQLNDAIQAAADRQNELEQEVASVRSTLSETEGELTNAKGDTDDAQRKAREREAELSTRLENVTRKLEWAREPERADGQILETSEALDLAWIDLGKKNRLYGGMRFAIVDGRAGDDTVKGWCEVLRVEETMAEVKMFDIRDVFDPPTAGDIIFNPLYDPTGLRNAVLLGRFSGTYNEKELRAVLDGINIHVQEGLDKTTDYLIVGAELYVDEDGEPLEDPVQPSDLPIYKEAEAMGMRIVPIKLVTDYFRKTRP